MADQPDLSSLPISVRLGILSMMDPSVQNEVLKDTVHERLPPVKFLPAKTEIPSNHVLQTTDLQKLENVGYVVKDGFLGKERLSKVLVEAEQLRAKKKLKLAGMGTGNGKWADSNVRGDEVLWLNSILEQEKNEGEEKLDEADIKEISALVKDIDNIRQQLNAVSEFKSEKTQTHITCYPGNGARYIRHLDAYKGGSERRITCLYYLNANWKPEHGGQLRLFNPLPSQQIQITQDDNSSSYSHPRAPPSTPRTDGLPPTPASTPRVDVVDSLTPTSLGIPPTPTSTPRFGPESASNLPPTPASTPRLGPEAGLPPTPASTPRTEVAQLKPGQSTAPSQVSSVGLSASLVSSSVASLSDTLTHTLSGINIDTLADIEPVGDRLIVFQSRLLEHEVLATNADRYALTVWFY